MLLSFIFFWKEKITLEIFLSVHNLFLSYCKSTERERPQKDHFSSVGSHLFLHSGEELNLEISFNVDAQLLPGLYLLPIDGSVSTSLHHTFCVFAGL